MFDITQIVNTSLYVAWYPKFVFSKNFFCSYTISRAFKVPKPRPEGDSVKSQKKYFNNNP